MLATFHSIFAASSCGCVKLLDCVWDIQDNLDISRLVAVLQCRDLFVHVYCLFSLADMFATMSPSGT